MHEIEVKLRVESHDPIRRRLGELGAKLIGRVVETNTIFDSTDGRLRQQGCGLRVRSTVDEDDGKVAATLTFKGPVLPGAFKRREELEVEISDGAIGEQLLERLGFVGLLRFEKRRESWTYGTCRIELDEPPHIGRFVEIEGPSEDAIRKVRIELGLGQVPHVHASYIKLLLAYCREQGLTEKTLRLKIED
ncbi:MAG: class IV adenylate cyclase [Planctomycetes bacterium]|nr:class IV adenylate cyclase [Planctomycetota bacterium]